MIYTPYLIQRGKIKRPLNDYRDTRLSQAVEFDYMGSAEFEFGALPKSFRAIEANIDAATLRIVPQIMQGEIALRVFSCLSDEQWAEYLPMLMKLRNDTLHTKELTRFAVGYMSRSEYGFCDFWWDIDNHVMFSFDKPFMNHVGSNIVASLNFINTPKD